MLADLLHRMTKLLCLYAAGMQDAVDLLHPLLTDTVDFVKQGALIATALVLMQQPESKVSACVTSLPVSQCSCALQSSHA